MTLEEVIGRRVASAEVSLLSAHSADGRYVAFDEEPFSRLGIAAPDLVGRAWQDYCPAHLVDEEQSVVTRVFYSGRSEVVTGICRLWPGRSISARGRISLVETRSGSRVILREGLDVHHLTGSEEEMVTHAHTQALSAADQIATALDQFLADGRDVPEHVREKIGRAREEAERIVGRRVRRVLS